MDMGQIIGIGLIGTILSLMLKRENAQMSLIVSVATGVLIFLILCAPLGNLVSLLQEAAEKGGVGSGYFGIVLKVIGIAYLAQFGAQLCADAGEGAIASKIEMAGKVLIMATSAPVLTSLLEMVMNLV